METEKAPRQNTTEASDGQVDISLDNEKNRDIATKRVIWYNIEEEGLLHGILNLNNDDFEQFLEAQQEKSLSTILQNRIRSKKSELKQKLDTLPEKRSALKKTAIESEQERKLLGEEVDHLNEKKAGLEQQIRMLSLEIKKINPYYTGFFAFLFVVAGFVFMAGDFLYTKKLSEVVLGEQGVASIVFALAIAFLAIVIKPAVDRVFEAPYQQKTNTVRSKVFLFIVSILLLVILGVLGFWRGTSLENTFTILNEASSLEEALAAQNEALRSPALVTILTSLSAFFALSGAICFSIGVPVLKDTIKRSRLKKEAQSKLIESEKLDDKIQENRKRISELAAAKEVADFEYAHLDDPLVLQKQYDMLDQQEEEEIRAMFEYKVKEKLGYYREAVAKGDKVHLSGNLVMSAYQLYRILGLPVQPSSGRKRSQGTAGNGSGEKEKERERSDYLHQRLRDVLRHEFQTKSK